MCLIAKSLCMLHAIDVKLSTDGDTIILQSSICTAYYMYWTPHLLYRRRGGCPHLRHVPQSPHSPVGTRSGIGTTHKLLGDLKNTVMNVFITEKKHTTRYN